MNIKTFLILGVLLLVSACSAVPTAGAAYGITSNTFTSDVIGSDGGLTWIAWGQSSGNNNWASAPIMGNGAIMVYGAPLLGDTTVYYTACDTSGCGAEQIVTIPAITPVPVPTFGAAYTNLSAQHFRIDKIPAQLMTGFVANSTTPTVMFGIIALCIFVGFWFRTRSVRLTLIVGLLLDGMLIGSTNALGFAIPLEFIAAGVGFAAVCIAGIAISFIRK